MFSKQNVIKRIKDYCNEVNLTQKDVSDALNIPYRTIQSYFSGARDPSLEFVYSFCDCYNISLNWLLQGVENYNIEKLSNSSKNTLKKTLVQSNIIPVEEKSKTVRIAFANPQASMGSGAHVNEENKHFLDLSKTLIDSAMLGVSNYSKLFAMRVMGDSMYPDIDGGSIVIGEILPNSYQQSHDGIYIIRYNGLLMCKKIQKITNQHYIIISTNPIYSPIEVYLMDESTDFKVIAKVLAKLQKLDNL